MHVHTTLLARQPIHDREMRIAGYELLFRTGDSELALVSDNDTASAEVITRALLDYGLDKLVGNSRAWINMGRDFLVARHFEVLPPDRVVLEVLETVSCDDDVVEALRDARRMGFKVALDDFELRSDTSGLIDECDIIKLDCLGRSSEELKEQFAAVSRPRIKLLAEKVESLETFETCRAAGAHLFQGYFFTRPATVKGAAITTNRLQLMRVLAEIHDPDVSIARLAELIQADVGLAYRIMRYANSAALGRVATFRHLRDAITMLGLNRVRACVSLLMLGALSNKPIELASLALVRARHCQLIGAARRADEHRHFMAGLFSVLDAYLDEPMDQVVRRLGLDEELTAALSAHEGRLGQVLDAAIAYEQADWGSAAVPGISRLVLGNAYLDALAWSNSMHSALDAA